MNLINVGILIICLLIIYYLVRKYLEFVEKQKKNPIFIKDPVNAKKPYIRNKEDIPLPKYGNGYTLSVWLWVDDFEYLKGSWRHILHKGDRGAEKCQPSIWLHPKENKLYVFFDSDDRKYNYTKINKNLMLNTYLSRNDKYYEAIHNTNLRELKKECNSNKDCESISVVCKNIERDEDHCQFGILNLTDTKYKDDPDLFFTYEDKDIAEFNLDNYTNIGTIDKLSEASSMNPNRNSTLLEDTTLYVSVDNIPLGRWFNFVLVIESRACSVYIDGKLKNTKALESDIKQNDGDLYVTNCGGFGGLLTQLRYYEKSLSYNEVLNIYRWGPNPWQWPEFLLGKKKWKKPDKKDKDKIESSKKFLCKEGVVSVIDYTKRKYTCDNIKGILKNNGRKKFNCELSGGEAYKFNKNVEECQAKNCSRNECCIQKKSCEDVDGFGSNYYCKKPYENTGAYCAGESCKDSECCSKEKLCSMSGIQCGEGRALNGGTPCSVSLNGCTEEICCRDAREDPPPPPNN